MSGHHPPLNRTTQPREKDTTMSNPNIIRLTTINGVDAEMIVDDEDGGETTVIEFKDWETGADLGAFEFPGDMDDFQRAVAALQRP